MNSIDRTIPVALSARHVHLSQRDVEALFGSGCQLTPLQDLTQPGQFSARETVEVLGPKRSIPGVRVLGPARGDSQVELSLTDGFILGINIPVKASGDIEDTPGVHLIGPRGAVKLKRGVISAMRHIHATPEDARRLGLKDRQKVYIRFLGPRGLIFDEVLVRISEQFFTEAHLDTDEGNAAGVRAGDRVEVVSSLCTDLCSKESCLIADGVRGGYSKPFCELTANRLTIR